MIFLSGYQWILAMKKIPDEKCEWGVNTLGNVMAALPRFHRKHLYDASLVGGSLVFRHDGARKTSITVPPRVLEYIVHEPSILLVVFEAGGNPTEIDVRLSRAE